MKNDSCPANNPSSVEHLFPWDEELNEPTKPDDRTIPLGCTQPSNVIEKRTDPIESIAYIGSLIEKYLADPNNIHREALRSSLQAHPVTVRGVGFYNTAAQGDRPCIYIKYAGMKSQQDFAWNNSAGYNIHNATEKFYCKWVMGFSVYAISTQYMESLALAEEIRRFLHWYQLPIKQSLCWEKLQVVEAQAPAYDDNFECYTTTISCTATYGDSWALQEAAPLLKKATLNTSVL